MDPKAAILGALRAFFDDDWLSCAERLGAYQEWRAREGFEPELSGFEPELSRDDALVASFGLKHPGCILDADHIAANLADDLIAEINKLGEWRYGRRFTPQALDHLECLIIQGEGS